MTRRTIFTRVGDDSDYSPPDYQSQAPVNAEPDYTPEDIAKAAALHTAGTANQFLGGDSGGPINPRVQFAQLNWAPGYDSTSPFLMPSIEVREAMDPVRPHDIAPYYVPSSVSGTTTTTGLGYYESGILVINGGA